mmetsp:Transcript_27279/g.51928  ORF Transcript_27279/g.51928 Transcript_27279/m.51928 type:complete len:243 (+) Transcript_27279:322-1050(+)
MQRAPSTDRIGGAAELTPGKCSSIPVGSGSLCKIKARVLRPSLWLCLAMILALGTGITVHMGHHAINTVREEIESKRSSRSSGLEIVGEARKRRAAAHRVAGAIEERARAHLDAASHKDAVRVASRVASVGEEDETARLLNRIKSNRSGFAFLGRNKVTELANNRQWERVGDQWFMVDPEDVAKADEVAAESAAALEKFRSWGKWVQEQRELERLERRKNNPPTSNDHRSHAHGAQSHSHPS